MRNCDIDKYLHLFITKIYFFQTISKYSNCRECLKFLWEFEPCPFGHLNHSWPFKCWIWEHLNLLPTSLSRFNVFFPFFQIFSILKIIFMFTNNWPNTKIKQWPNTLSKNTFRNIYLLVHINTYNWFFMKIFMMEVLSIKGSYASSQRCSVKIFTIKLAWIKTLQIRNIFTEIISKWA